MSLFGIDKNIDIKTISNEDITYKVGYTICDEEIYPYIKLYEHNRYIGVGKLNICSSIFCFIVRGEAKYYSGNVNTIDELFNGLSQYKELPIEVKEEFENICILYKLKCLK